MAELIKRRIAELGEEPYKGHRTDRPGIYTLWIAPRRYRFFYRIDHDEVVIIHIRTVVCPRPNVWAELHRRLQEASTTNRLPPPPVPLILAGWWGSNDVQKQNRWQEALAWAERYGLGALLGDVAEESMYTVAKLSYHIAEDDQARRELNWSSDSKPRADAVARTKAMEVLQANWAKIAGAELAAITLPLRLTGSKGRRLEVLVKTEDAPPWGSWTALDERRRSFTAFRTAVNRAIAPLEVDHIDFVGHGSPAS